MRRVFCLLGILGLAAAVAACWFAGSYLIATHPASVGALPSDLPVEPVSLHTSDGRQVNGWFVPGQTGQGAVVLLHHIRGSRRSMVGRARFLHRAGYAILLIDLQGHGETPGVAMTFGFLEALDAEASVRYLKSRLPGEKIGVLGVSLGGAAALLGETTAMVDAVALEMVYTTLAEATENRLVFYLGAIGRYLSPLLLWQIGPRLGFDPDDLAPIDRIGSVKAPLLLIAGSEDKRVTIEQSRRLFSRAPDSKSLWVIAGAGHQNLHRFAGQAYERRLLGFFNRTLR